jgi:hypothetical protein
MLNVLFTIHTFGPQAIDSGGAKMIEKIYTGNDIINVRVRVPGGTGIRLQFNPACPPPKA